MNREILRLAVPNIISNIAVPVLGVIELTITGHLGSELYIGAIGVGGMVFNFLFWMFAFLRMSMSGLTAQSFGSGDKDEIRILLYRGVLLGLLFGFILVLLQRPLGDMLFSLLKASPQVKVLASQYYYLRIWSAPATLAMYAIMGWFIGMQNARAPMWISILSSASALGFNVWFVFGLHMKSDGIALGTLLSQYFAFMLAVVWLILGYRPVLSGGLPSSVLLVRSASRFFSVNRDIFVRMLCVVFVFSFFTFQSANTDNFILAVNTILIQFLFFFSFFIDGFAYAGEALVGRFTGASDIISLRKVVKGLFCWGFVIVVPFVFVYVLFDRQILALITNRADVLSAAEPYLIWVKLIPVLTFAAFVWDGIYIGAAASRSMRNTMLVSTILFFIPIYFVLRQYVGNHALWLALLAFMLSRGAQLTILSKKIIFKR